MKQLILLAVTIFLFNQAQAQSCGTIFSEEQRESVMKHLHNSRQHRAGLSKTDIEIPLIFIIVRDDNGQGGMDSTLLMREFDRINELYAAAGMSFKLCQDFVYVDNDDFVSFDRREEDDLAAEFYQPGALNIYFCPSVRWGSLALCGYSKFPPSEDRIIMANSCSSNGSTLAHEIGHYFALFHTHETFNGAELVARTNCESAGDGFCDTPADPNLQGRTNNSCEYLGGQFDTNGEPYEPMVSNLMSYATKECRDSFTTEQLNRMNYSAINERFYVDCCAKPVAKMGITVLSGSSSNARILFSDSSYVGQTRKWILNGDTLLSLSQIYEEFEESGDYVMKLIVSNECGSDTLERGFTVKGNLVYPLSIEENDERSFKLYPNPTRSLLNIQADANTLSGAQLRVFSVSGKVIMQENLPLNQNGIHSLNIENLESGIYFLELQSDNWKSSRKIIKY